MSELGRWLLTHFAHFVYLMLFFFFFFCLWESALLKIRTWITLWYKTSEFSCFYDGTKLILNNALCCKPFSVKVLVRCTPLSCQTYRTARADDFEPGSSKGSYTLHNFGLSQAKEQYCEWIVSIPFCFLVKIDCPTSFDDHTGLPSKDYLI